MFRRSLDQHELVEAADNTTAPVFNSSMEIRGDVVPEPGTLTLVASGALIGIVRRRRQRKAS